MPYCCVCDSGAEALLASTLENPSRSELNPRLALGPGWKLYAAGVDAQLYWEVEEMDEDGEWRLSGAESGCVGGVRGSDWRGVVAALEDV